MAEGPGFEAMAGWYLVGGSQSVGRERPCEVASDRRDAKVRAEVLVGRGQEDVSAKGCTVQAPVGSEVHAVDPYDYAKMLLTRDMPGDRNQAHQLLAAAAEQYQKLGMTPWLARSAELAVTPR